MAHIVKCIYCDTNFDRDTTSYVKLNSRRYGHAKCYLLEKEKNPKLKELEIIDPNNFVECCYCKKIIDKSNKDTYKQISLNRYAHLECIELEGKREKTDQEKLELYIQKLFNIEYVYPNLRKQINQYIKNYNYTYSGILKALSYFYEIKKNPLPSTKTLGIVPYIYEDAYYYYYSSWLANETNKNKELSQLIPKEIEVVITSPKRDVIIKKKFFQFLDKDEVNE